MKIWVIGTSVSVSKHGYAGILAQIADPVPVINISMGDQTSIMGLIRVLMHIDKIEPGDVVIWEYPLLDILLAGFFDPADTLTAARQAWQHILARGAQIIVLASIAKRHLAKPSDQEEAILREAESLEIKTITTRDIFNLKGLSIDEREDEYSDDRHFLVGSFVHEAMAKMIFSTVNELSISGPTTLSAPPSNGWTWIAGADLFAPDDFDPVEVRNSFVSFPAVRPRMNRKAALPEGSRLICVAISATRESGSIWCGHSLCAPASTRLSPANSKLPMLFRTTRVPCVRSRITTIEVAPTHSFTAHSWADYGLNHVSSPAPVEIAGVLIEPKNLIA